MKTILHTEWTVADICKGFTYNELEGKGLFGLDGRLTIQPEYQRHYIYNDGKRDVAVIESLLKGKGISNCPPVSHRRQYQQDTHLQIQRDGCRPCDGIKKAAAKRSTFV